jgi:hypothetical protein
MPAMASLLLLAANVHSNSTAAVFDPQALTQSLESAIYALLPLREKVAARTNDCDTTVKHAERDYTSKLAELKANFQAVSTSFSSLESRISEVGRTAIKIGRSARLLACIFDSAWAGDQLESIDRLKQRALEAHDIITFYFDFARGDTTKFVGIHPRRPLKIVTASRR